MEKAWKEISVGDSVNQLVPEKHLADSEIIKLFGQQAVWGSEENAQRRFDSKTERYDLEIPDNIILGEN